MARPEFNIGASIGLAPIDSSEWVERLTTALDEDHFALYEQTIQPLTGYATGKYCQLLVRLPDGRQQYRAEHTSYLKRKSSALRRVSMAI
ncbi:MAG: hypothetical protein GKR94_08420 [Gammaproteobacteria bacterium]|nr:hypothetical protein [Gammaproteobacteria bacterium]